MSILPKQAVLEYQEIYKKIYGKEIALEKATELSNRLINLVVIIEKPLDEDEKLYNNTKRSS